MSHFVKIFLGFTALIFIGILGLVFAEKITGGGQTASTDSTRQ